jgi:hypothetical protein
MGETNQIRDAIGLLYEAGQVVELRVLDTGRTGTVSGYFDDYDELAKATAQWDNKAPGVYWMLNPIKPALLARACNRAKPYAKTTTIDDDIERRTWLPLDFDPIRPKGISSTDPQHEWAIDQARACADYLSGEGWPQPILADSGNGAHLLYRIDLPNDDHARDLISRTLQKLAGLFSDDIVTVDQKVFNAARIWKAYGTVAAKGDSTPDRPHRRAGILTVPDKIQTVDIKTFEEFVGPREEAPARQQTNIGAGTFNLDNWMQNSGLKITKTDHAYAGGSRWEYICPWRENDGPTGYVTQRTDGVIRAGCNHDTCEGSKQGWHGLRELYEPAANRKRQQRPQVAPVVVPAQTEEEHADNPDPAEPDFFADYRDMPFPYEVLPAPFGNFIVETAASVCVHPDMVATFMLPVLGALIGNSRELGYKTDWQERCRIWAAVVADPGAKKTPAMKKVLAPLAAIQRRLNKQNEHMRAEWLELSNEERKKTPEPQWQQLVVDNTTPEALSSVFKDHPRGILMKKDELAGWVEACGQYKGGKGDERQQNLSLWSGDNIVINRKGDGKIPLVIDNPHFNVVGGIQPEKVHVLIGKDDDGLSYRFLYCWPPKVDEKADTPSVSFDVRKGYEEMCERLYSLTLGLETAKVKTTPAGRQRLILQTQKILDEKNHPAMSAELRGYWAKFEAYHLRLTLILAELWHVSDGTPEEVDEVIAELGESLVNYYKGQAIKLFGDSKMALSRPDLDKSSPRLWSTALQWMDDGRQSTTLRDLCRGPWRKVPHDEAMKMLLTLQMQGQLTFQDGVKGSIHVSRRIKK